MAKSGIVATYTRLARNYDLEEKLLLLAGIRMGHYRDAAVKQLNLKKGDTVVELACGTGLNFNMLQKAVGPNGRVIGVDITDAMLSEARKRVAKNRWKNVELVHSDMANYDIPEADGIISTCAITLVPEYADVIRKGAESLKDGGRFAIMDFKKPEWPMWLIKIAVRLFIEPYGGTLEMSSRHPWEYLDKYLESVCFREYYFGGIYLAVGEKRKTPKQSIRKPRK